MLWGKIRTRNFQLVSMSCHKMFKSECVKSSLNVFPDLLNESSVLHHRESKRSILVDHCNVIVPHENANALARYLWYK